MAYERVSGERGIAKLRAWREGSVGSVNEMAAWGRGVWGLRGPERVVGW